MTPLVFLALSAAGGVGAALRLFTDGVVRSRVKIAYPLGTTIINVAGSFILGLITGAALSHVVAESWHLVIGTGLMGGFTTFSTASFETVRLLQERRWVAALMNGFGMLVLAVLAALAGLAIGGAL